MKTRVQSRQGSRGRVKLLAAAAGFFMAAGVWGADESRPVLRVLTMFDPNTRAAAERVHAFEAAHGCWVDWDMRMRSDIRSVLEQDPGRYDVVVVDEPWIPRFSEALRPLSEWPRAGVVRPADPLGSWQGSVYGIPMLKNLYLYVYRADVLGDPELARRFERAHRERFAVPTEVDDFLTISQFLHDETAFAGLAAVEQPSEALVIDLLWLLRTTGVDLTRPEIRANPDTDLIEIALERVQAMHRVTVPTPDVRSLEEVNQAYERAEVAHVLQWAGLGEALRNPLFSRIGAETGFAPLPGSSEIEPFSITGDWFLAIPRTSPEGRVALAAAFADWYASVAEPGAILPEPVSENLSGVRVWSRPRLVRYEAFSGILSDAARAVLVPDASVGNVARELAANLQRFEQQERRRSE